MMKALVNEHRDIEPDFFFTTSTADFSLVSVFQTAQDAVNIMNCQALDDKWEQDFLGLFSC